MLGPDSISKPEKTVLCLQAGKISCVSFKVALMGEGYDNRNWDGRGQHDTV